MIRFAKITRKTRAESRAEKRGKEQTATADCLAPRAPLLLPLLHQGRFSLALLLSRATPLFSLPFQTLSLTSADGACDSDANQIRRPKIVVPIKVEKRSSKGSSSKSMKKCRQNSQTTRKEAGLALHSLTILT